MKRHASSVSSPLRVAIIGAGPSGFYAAEALLNSETLQVECDIFDRLPTPYGLVRGGVAPDHQKIKRVSGVYERIARRPGFRFFGNVKLGVDLQVADLLAHFDAIIYAYGNEADKRLNLAGESAGGCHSATEFVGWYNAHPDFVDARFDLKGKSAVIIGMGNVAMDVARVLARNPEELLPTDIAEHAMPTLRNSGVKDIYILARRGPAQAAFSPKEIKELGKLENADLIVSKAGSELDEPSRLWLEKHQDPAANKNVKYLSSKAAEPPENKERQIHLLFYRSPQEILVSDQGGVIGVRCAHTQLVTREGSAPGVATTGEFSTIKADVVFKAIGYRGEAVPGVPFHEKWGTVPNKEGRVLEEVGGPRVPGQYVVGWAKRGPTGLIGTNKPDSIETVKALLLDYEGEPPHRAQKGGASEIEALLKSKGVRFVGFDDYLRIEAEEQSRGSAKGKLREKFPTIESMIEFLDS